MNKEKLDKQLTGQASSISPFMKLGDDTSSAQQKMLNPQEIEAISSRVYNMSLQQDKTGKPFKPQVYQRRGRGQRQNYGRDRSRSNNRQGQNFGQNGCRNDYSRNGYTQNFSRNNGRGRGGNANCLKQKLQYMGNTIFIQGKTVCVKPLHSWLEAIQKLEPPKTVKGCRSFAGMVNFLSIFCQDLQKLLKTIYDLTRRGKPFIWQQEQQTVFEEIKSRLQEAPILHLPDGKGRFHLYSDTSKYATGSALYQIQNGKPKLIAYASKRLPEAARNYSITDLEMCGLAINIANFAHLLKKVDFDAMVDHLALVHILKSKTEPATAIIIRLLEILSAYSLNLYYMKGKDMILSDFLSRQEIDKSDLHEIIPISFDMKVILNEKYYKTEEEGKYLVQT